jgi:hypothetical protein
MSSTVKKNLPESAVQKVLALKIDHPFPSFFFSLTAT